jgi:hypothetical protein
MASTRRQPRRVQRQHRGGQCGACNLESGLGAQHRIITILNQARRHQQRSDNCIAKEMLKNY